MSQKINAEGIPQFDGSAVTQPISAASLPLPTGAATEAGNLATIAAKDFSTETTLAAIKTAAEILDNIVSGTLAIVAQKDLSGNAIGGKYILGDDGNRLEVKKAIIDCASSGDNTIVAAVAGKKIRVISLFLLAAGTVTVRFEDGAGGTALTGQMNLVANTGFVLPENKSGWFIDGTANTLLNLELSAAISVDGSISYVEV